MPFQERDEGLSRRAPVEALHRTVVQHPVDALDLLVEDVIERTSLRKNFAHDAVPVLVRLRALFDVHAILDLATPGVRYFFASQSRVLRFIWRFGSGAGPPSTGPCGQAPYEGTQT